MTYYLRSANTYKPTTEAALDVHKTLPVGNYIIQQDRSEEHTSELQSH